MFFFPGKKMPAFPASIHARLLKKTNDGVYAAVTTLQEERIEGNEFPLPPFSLKEIETQLDQLLHRETEIETDLRELARLLPNLERQFKELDDQVQFQEARAGMKTEGRIACL